MALQPLPVEQSKPRARPHSAGRLWRVLLLLCSLNCPSAPNAQTLRYPSAPRGGVVNNYHGTEVADPYRRLENLYDPRTVEWLRAEQRLTSAYLRRIPGREQIRRRLTAL